MLPCMVSPEYTAVLLIEWTLSEPAFPQTYHVPDIQPLLDQFAGVLRPAGLLAVADFDCDEGKFHESNEGVFHSGFDRCAMLKHFERAGFEKVRNRTAAILPGMAKPVPGEGPRTFTLFLMTGQKRG